MERKGKEESRPTEELLKKRVVISELWLLMQVLSGPGPPTSRGPALKDEPGL
jgi:hypothetical protein